MSKDRGFSSSLMSNFGLCHKLYSVLKAGDTLNGWCELWHIRHTRNGSKYWLHHFHPCSSAHHSPDSNKPVRVVRSWIHTHNPSTFLLNNLQVSGPYWFPTSELYSWGISQTDRAATGWSFGCIFSPDELLFECPLHPLPRSATHLVPGRSWPAGGWLYAGHPFADVYIWSMLFFCFWAVYAAVLIHLCIGQSSSDRQTTVYSAIGWWTLDTCHWSRVLHLLQSLPQQYWSPPDQPQLLYRFLVVVGWGCQYRWWRIIHSDLHAMSIQLCEYHIPDILLEEEVWETGSYVRWGGRSSLPQLWSLDLSRSPSDMICLCTGIVLQDQSFVVGAGGLQLSSNFCANAWMVWEWRAYIPPASFSRSPAANHLPLLLSIWAWSISVQHRPASRRSEEHNAICDLFNLRNGIILTIQAVCALRYEGIHTLFWFSIYCLIISRGAPPTVEMKYELVHNVGKRVRRLLYSCRNSLELRPLMNRTNKCTPYCGCISQSKWTWSGTLAPHASAGVISISMISTCFSADVSQIIFSNLTATSSTSTLRRYFGHQTIGYLQE